MSLCAFRPSVRLSHKKPPEEQSGAQQSRQEGKATQLWDYYNVSPGTAPPLDETVLLHDLKETGTTGVDTQSVSFHLHLNNVQEETYDLSWAKSSHCFELDINHQEMMEPIHDMTECIYVCINKQKVTCCCIEIISVYLKMKRSSKSFWYFDLNDLIK